MSDVAKLAGVGTMTVSRVLNGNVHVTEETRARVMAAITKLQYVPNEVARSLRDQRTRQIGIIVPNLHDPFFAICSHAISLIAKQHSYSTVITTSDEDAETEFVEAKRMLRRHIEGLIVVPASGKSKLLDPEFESTPMVTLDRPVPASSFDSVLAQNKHGAQLGVRHLIDHQHRHIVCLGLTSELWTMRERLDGYLAAMKAAKLEPSAHVLSESPAEMLETVRQLMGSATPPTAFFCSNNLIMRNALHALSALQIKIPEEIALLGFDDFEMADILKPAVTVVRQPMEDMGRIAAELLFSRLADGQQSAPAKQIVLSVELVVRDSCGSHA
jgi:LacI family transcriptional regulator